MQELCKSFLCSLKKSLLVFFFIIFISSIVIAENLVESYNDPLTISVGDVRWCVRNGVCTLSMLTVDNIIVQNLSVIGDVFNVTMNLVTWNITENFNVGGNLEAKNITAQNFFGIYDWIIKLGRSRDYADFNGTDWSWNETTLNATIKDLTRTITYNATSIETRAGTPEGDVESIKGIKDGNVYNVTEAAGANPLVIVINFTGVESFSEIVMREIYSAGSGHNIKIGIETCATGEYEEEFQPDITGMDNFAIRVETVVDPFNHLCGDNVSIRLRHDENGNPFHEFSLDFLVIQSGPTTMVSEEVDPLAFHRSGDVVMQGNSSFGDFAIDEVSISAEDVDRDIASDCPADNYAYAWGDNLSTWFCRLDKTNSTDDMINALTPANNQWTGENNFSGNTTFEGLVHIIGVGNMLHLDDVSIPSGFANLIKISNNSGDSIIDDNLFSGFVLRGDGLNGWWAQFMGNPTDSAYRIGVKGKNASMKIRGDGRLEWGGGDGIFTLNLFRASPVTLKTDDIFSASILQATGSISSGSDINAKPTSTGATADADWVLLGGSTFQLRRITSSSRFKENIQSLDYDTSYIYDLDIQQYQHNFTLQQQEKFEFFNPKYENGQFVEDYIAPFKEEDYIMDRGFKTGVIAEEVYQINPDATIPLRDKDGKIIEGEVEGIETGKIQWDALFEQQKLYERVDDLEQELCNAQQFWYWCKNIFNATQCQYLSKYSWCK